MSRGAVTAAKAKHLRMSCILSIGAHAHTNNNESCNMLASTYQSTLDLHVDVVVPCVYAAHIPGSG